MNTTISWEKLLHPKTLKTNLMSISLFITAFEVFKANIIEKPETFYLKGFDENGLIIDEKRYNDQVLSLSSRKNKLYASLHWFERRGAITNSDIEFFDEIRKHRNEIAHEPMCFLIEHKKNLELSKFKDLIKLFSKIEKWWLINFEAAIDPKVFPEGVKPEEVIPGPIWSLRLMLNIALGNEPEEGFYYNEFVNNKT